MTEKQFRKIVTLTKPAVLGAIRAYLSPDLAHAIDDVAQNTYVRIYRALRKGGGPSKHSEATLRSWSYVIARNECFRLQKSEASNRRKMEVASDLFLLNEWIQYGEQDRWMDQDALERSLQQLEEPFRETMTLLVQGHSLAEIGIRTGAPEGTVKSRVHRARERLKEILIPDSPGKMVSQKDPGNV
ncbi:MAG: hypothetical protein CMN76_12515 [Spirochaetaceae bacterium]|nr:hypothetical protein [Spirochaetaceae bacterium]